MRGGLKKGVGVGGGTSSIIFRIYLPWRKMKEKRNRGKSVSEQLVDGRVENRSTNISSFAQNDVFS